MTRDELLAHLRAHGWRLSAAARALGMKPNTLQQRVSRAGLNREAIVLLKHGASVVERQAPPAPAVSDTTADAYAEAAAQIAALTETCVSLAALVTTLQDALDRERGLSAHLAAKLETYAVEAAA